MDSEDSRDGTGDARSSSSSSSSSSRSRRSSSSSDTSKKDAKSPPQSPRAEGPRSPSQGPRSPSPTARSPSAGPRSPSQGPRSPSPGPRSPSPESQSESIPTKKPHSPDNLSEAHSDINSPENSPPASPAEPKSPEGPKSPSDAGSNIGSPDPVDQYSGSPSVDNGPKTPQSPSVGPKSPGSPDGRSRASADSASQAASPRQQSRRSPSSSPSPERQSPPSSPPPRSPEKPTQWRPEEKWRRHTKAEQKMVPVPRERSRSESSASSRSSTYNKRGKDPATEEISEGEMESDQDEEKSKSRRSLKTSDNNDGKNLNISHEDLSDVSDLDSMSQDDADKEIKAKTPSASPDKQEIKVNGASLQTSPKSDSGKAETPRYEKVPQEKTSNTEDGEEQLDFEAEEGECVEPKPAEQNGDNEEKPVLAEEIQPGKRSRGSSLEEGEVSDEAERRPEESEPRPVCRFFSRGACTWGVSCRFLHPGVTDKGNYNMFEVVRGVPSTGSYPPPGARDVAPPESAWERGLRTAKEMLRIANKRKEQDMDFEEKKLHLSVGGVVHDPDAELAYAAAAVGASPPRADAPHHRELDPYGRPERVPPYGPMYRGRGFARPPAEDRERYYERERGYDRERAYERPPYYDDRPPADDLSYHKRRVRSSREVIVQRAEVERRESRREPRGGEEWADPWMRTEPARRRKPPSSDDSYSSSSSSNSSSRSSRSPTSRRKRRASSSSRQRLSPSVIVRERRLASARATAMNPPAPRRRAPSPAAARQLLSANPPPPPPHHRHKEEVDQYGRTKPSRDNRKKYSRSSSSGSESSSSSSESESDSHSSSTSGSSGARRARHARLLNAAARPRLNAKSNAAGLAAAVTIANKKESSSEKESGSGGKKRSATSPVDTGPSKKAVSRREELLKQLKAVEDAIARKRSKI